MLKEELKLLREELLAKAQLEPQKPTNVIMQISEQYDNKKADIMYEEVLFGLKQIVKKNPNEKVIQVSCSPNGTASVCIGTNNTVINRSLNKLNVEYLQELAETDGIEVVSKMENDQLVNIDFIIDYRTEEEKMIDQLQQTTIETEQTSLETLKSENIETSVETPIPTKTNNLKEQAQKAQMRADIEKITSKIIKEMTIEEDEENFQQPFVKSLIKDIKETCKMLFL